VEGPQRIHVAGVKDAREARLLAGCGVKRLGLPLALDHHAQDLSVEQAAALVAEVGARAGFFVITYLSTAEEVAQLCRTVGVDLVQLHGAVADEELAALRRGRHELRVIKSLIVRGGDGEALLHEARRVAPWVDAFILDTFDPETGASGATGKTHDWTISRRLAESCPRPLILAGGLRPANVREAIVAVRPAGVDVHTGVEGADGRKRRDLVWRFVAEAEAGFRAVGG
jgi:phosphoribosylanthranilate isomerase